MSDNFRPFLTSKLPNLRPMSFPTFFLRNFFMKNKKKLKVANTHTDGQRDLETERIQ